MSLQLQSEIMFVGSLMVSPSFLEIKSFLEEVEDVRIKTRGLEFLTSMESKISPDLGGNLEINLTEKEKKFLNFILCKYVQHIQDRNTDTSKKFLTEGTSDSKLTSLYFGSFHTEAEGDGKLGIQAESVLGTLFGS